MHEITVCDNIKGHACKHEKNRYPQNREHSIAKHLVEGKHLQNSKHHSCLATACGDTHLISVMKVWEINFFFKI